MSEASSPPKAFLGIRFALFGFDSTSERKVRATLINGGGVDAGQYGPSCTHVIVERTIYDDPVCVAARNDGKTLVTGLWVDHSFDIGMPVDPTSIMYRPLIDLNGIPGGKSLIVCLTGYQRQDRDDIMTMVGLMGARFSKPLVANKVTHLICYKFEGEKYELAKKMRTIKLVNHRWLEDCLRDWELLPEANYNKSGYELEMMEAEAKDSEEEAGDTTVKQYGGENENNSLHNFKNRTPEADDLLKSNLDVPKLSPSQSVLKGRSSFVCLPSTPRGKDANISVSEALDHHCTNTVNNTSAVEMLGGPEQRDGTPVSRKVINDLDFTSTSAGKDPYFDTKFRAISYSRKPTARSSPLVSAGKEGNVGGSPKLHLGDFKITDAFDISSSEVEHDKDHIGSALVEGHWNQNELCEVGSTGKKRKKDVSCASAKPQKAIHDKNARITGSTSVEHKTKGLERASLAVDPCETSNILPSENATKKSHTSALATKSPVSNKKSLALDLPCAETLTSETRPYENTEKVGETSVKGLSDLTLAFQPAVGDFGIGRSEQAAADAGELLHLQKDNRAPSPSKLSSETEKGLLVNFNSRNGGNDRSIAKPVKKKTLAKKTLGSRPQLCGTAYQKGSIYLKNTTSEHDPAIILSGKKDSSDNMNVSNVKELITSLSTLNVEAVKVVEPKTAAEPGNVTGDKTLFMDDETEAPEDNAGFEFEKEPCKERSELAELSRELDATTGMKSEGVKPVAPDLKASKHDDAASSDQCLKITNNYSLDDSTFRGDSVESRKMPFNYEKPKKIAAVVEKLDSEKKVFGNKGQKEKHIEQAKKGKEKILHSPHKNKNSTVSAKQSENNIEVEKENKAVLDQVQQTSQGKKFGRSVGRANLEKKINEKVRKVNPNSSPITKLYNQVRVEPAWFIFSGHKLQRKEFQKITKRLKGRFCRDSHQWSYQATHFIAPDPIRRTEKFFAAAAAGRWILNKDYLTACNQAGKFLAEEPFEWYRNGLSQDGAINLEAPRKWRLLRERTGHGAFYGMRIVIYGVCIAPPLDTLKRVVKAGDGTILATSPPYTRFFESGIDFAVVSPGMPHVDVWIQQFLKHEIPCVVADYLVEYVCKTGYSLSKHVLYNTHTWAEKSFANLLSKADEILENKPPEKILEGIPPAADSGCSDISCQVCGCSDREEVMLICGDEAGSVGCGVGMHIDCCDPPLENVPEEDWFCPECRTTPKKKKKGSSSLKKSK
ncbi:BRCT domain-containing protein [Tripterygium wilfordii]|uniref:BRCT domain-containing protein n=1 Tax=Tripterygium wilfordii TaxID=458696 RepID=A0A7J7BWW0_TRIWF|nr:BRCT domain-containing protein At4g02110 [Tripterygium wilfordii]KAF5726361.1 BRCT domain-containing protein [Tripterygium wilfordii]